MKSENEGQDRPGPDKPGLDKPGPDRPGPDRPGLDRPGAGRKRRLGSIPHLPMEWMDPMSWRLPSGKALAEFALQTGFLAPLIMRAPKITKKPAMKSMAGNPRFSNFPLTRGPGGGAPGGHASVW